MSLLCMVWALLVLVGLASRLFDIMSWNVWVLGPDGVGQTQIARSQRSLYKSGAWINIGYSTIVVFVAIAAGTCAAGARATFMRWLLLGGRR